MDVSKNTNFTSKRFEGVMSGVRPYRRPITGPAIAHQGMVTKLHNHTPREEFNSQTQMLSSVGYPIHAALYRLWGRSPLYALCAIEVNEQTLL